MLSAGIMGGVNRFRNETIGGTDLDNGREQQMSGRFDARHQLTSALELEAGGEVDAPTSRAIGSVPSPPRRIASSTTTRARARGLARTGRPDWTVAPWLSILPGVRVDHSSLTDDSTASPWLQAVWRLKPGTLVRGAYRRLPAVPDVRTGDRRVGDAGLEP